MAQIVKTLMVDDLDGTVLDDTGETVRFGLDGKNYVTELSAENAEQLRAALAPFIRGARRDKSSRGPRRKTTTRREKLDAMRAWATERGLPAPTRGRFPAELERQFDAEQAT